MTSLRWPLKKLPPTFWAALFTRVNCTTNGVGSSSRPIPVTLQIISRKALHAIWRDTLHDTWRKLPIWNNRLNFRKAPGSSHLIGSSYSGRIWKRIDPCGLAAAADMPFRTAQRWVAQYQRFGLAAPIRRKPTVNGERRTVSEAIRKAIEALALQTPPLPIATL